MKSLLESVEKLIRLDDLTELTLKKVEDSKVEFWEGSKYAGRQFVDYSKDCSNKAVIKDLEHGFLELQRKTIGLFKPYGSDVLELVVERTDWLLHTVNIGSLGGLSEHHIPENKGIYREFGQGRFLTDMKKNPFELDDFCKSFFKVKNS